MNSHRLTLPLVADRLVMLGVLISLLTKLQLFFVGYRVYRLLPVHDDFFPTAFQAPQLFLGCYLGAIAFATLNFLCRTCRSLLILKIPLALCLATLCVHQQTYNDVTFLTSFWSTIWSSWFVWYLSRNDIAQALDAGTLFSHAILSLVFLGAGLGKLTAGYWDGSVLYHIYFESRDFWVFNGLRDYLNGDQLRAVACWYSRGVIGTELACTMLWLLPPRLASGVAIFVLLGISLMSNFLLFSVVGSLLGLASVGLVATNKVSQRRAKGGRTTQTDDPRESLAAYDG